MRSGLRFHGLTAWFLCVSRILTNVTSMRLSVSNKIGVYDSFCVSMPPVFTSVLLCKEKNDALVELTLPKDANVYAAAYQLYLPDKALLQAKVKEWIEEFEENEELKKLEENQF